MSALGVLLGGWRSYAITAVACLACGFGSCWWLRDQMAAGAALKQANAVIAHTARADAITERAGAKAEAAQQVVRWRTRTLIEKVPIYVREDPDHPAMHVPVGFVRLHDAAAQGSVLPDAAGQPDDAPSGVALSAVAATVIDNYGTCLATREQLIGLQGWVRDQQAAWSKE